MKKIPAIISVLMVGSLVMPVMAEVYVMKNGERLDGRLIREDADSYLLEVEIHKGIKDELTVAKDQVESVQKSPEDFKAFHQIEKLVPTPDGLSEGEYLARIQRVAAFIRQHPTSVKLDVARSIQAELRAEMEEVRKGGVKFNGILYSAQTREGNAYEIDADMEAAKILRLIASEQHLAALRNFSRFEADYRATVAYSRLLPTVQEAANKYFTSVRQQLETYDRRLAERTKGLESMAIQDRHNSAAAIREETEQLEKRYKMERDARIEWVTPHPFCKSALDYTVGQAKSFISKLEAKMAAKPVDGGAIYREIMNLAKKGEDKAMIERQILEAKNKGMPEAYLARLREAVAGGNDAAAGGKAKQP